MGFWQCGPQLHRRPESLDFSLPTPPFLIPICSGELVHPILNVGLLSFPIPFPSKFYNFKVLIKLVFIQPSPIKCWLPCLHFFFGHEA